MNKRITKIICAMSSAVLLFTAAAFAGCSNVYTSAPLKGDRSGEVTSNGGFTVKKGKYYYFINGVETNDKNNESGTPVKGAVYRISESDLAARNYSSVERVVHNLAYSGNYNGGIFIYGDNIYYGTPSTAKNSEGVVQYSNLDMKSTTLDGSETMKDYYVQFPSTSYEYRYVEENDTVYLLYVATSETLYDEATGVTNLHSVNTKTGKDTVLAYNVASVMFDGTDKTNPRVYYTMNVYDYNGTSNTAYGYNQVYTVTASATTDKFSGKLNADTVEGWDKDSDRYINCGDLVLDGRGYLEEVTPFNSTDEMTDVTSDNLTYTLSAYENKTLFYTRTTPNNTKAYFFSLKDKEAAADGYSPVNDNKSADERILSDGSAANGYKYVFNGEELESVIIAEADGGISVNKVGDDGKLQTDLSIAADSRYYKIVKDGTATILGVEGDYLYYSLTGGNGYTIYRINHTGEVASYEALAPADANPDYQAVRVLDLDAYSGWYAPEFIDNYLFFASSASDMSSLNYIMTFDFSKDGGVMTNADIKALNEQYEGITEIINDTFGDTDKYPAATYANIQSVLRYAFYSGDGAYLEKLAKAVNEDLEEDADPVYSEETLAEFKAFFTPTAEGVWKDYTATRKVNGKDVYANSREYYYSVLGVMTDSDKKAHAESIRTTAGLTAYPEEEEVSWYEGLSTVEKVFFIIGMCLIGVLVIGGATLLTIYLVRRRRKKLPQMTKKRVKVDTTDDKSIDVYGE